MEIVPPIALTDFKTIKLERLTAPVTDTEIDNALKTLAEQNRPYDAKSEAAEKGDRVTVSFEGTLNGETFEGGSGTMFRSCSDPANLFRALKISSSASKPAKAAPST